MSKIDDANLKTPHVIRNDHDCYSFIVNWEDEDALSEFDQEYIKSWESKLDLGLFNYRVIIEGSKKIGDKFGFFAQLNTARAENRRKPEHIISVKQNFNGNIFNFTKLKQEEIMFVVKDSSNLVDDAKHFIAINSSPIDYGHSIILPDLFEQFPQIVTKRGLDLAISILLLSKKPAFRLGFNGLCAYASVNHQHFHAYYLNLPMKLETCQVKQLAGQCYFQEEFPAKGFVFQLTSAEEINGIIDDVLKLTSYLLDSNIAHNLFLTRALDYGSLRSSESGVRNCVRIYVWPRESSAGQKCVKGLNPGSCELFGHILAKDSEVFNSLTEDYICDMLTNLTENIYMRIKNEVKSLFEEKK